MFLNVIYLFIYLFIYLSIYLFIYLFIYLLSFLCWFLCWLVGWLVYFFFLKFLFVFLTRCLSFFIYSHPFVSCTINLYFHFSSIKHNIHDNVLLKCSNINIPPTMQQWWCTGTAGLAHAFHNKRVLLVMIYDHLHTSSRHAHAEIQSNVLREKVPDVNKAYRSYTALYWGCRQVATWEKTSRPIHTPQRPRCQLSVCLWGLDGSRFFAQ